MISKDWQMECLTIEQRVKALDSQAAIDRIMPLILDALDDNSIAPIIASMIVQNQFIEGDVTVTAHEKPYLKESVIVIKINHDN